MREAGSRARQQPPPPHVVFDALAHRTRDTGRPWLTLLTDEHPPAILHTEPPRLVVWSLWVRRPDAQVRFDISPDGGDGTRLRWTLLVADPVPDPPMLGHMRKRLNELINANLRYTFGA